MELIDKVIKCEGRGDVFEIYPIGDCHIGARSCAEKPLRALVKEIKDNPNAFWIGGGDIYDAIKPQDSKRFDMDIMPDWMLEGDALNTREKLNDILKQQYERGVEILEPIKSKCLGAIEGNHEYTIRKYYNQDLHRAFCNRMGIPHLSDEAGIRLKFNRVSGGSSSVVMLYIRHGYGGGRTAGAEPNKLFRMLAEWEGFEICFTGHTHTFDILPPKPVLEMPRKGELLPELTQRYRWAANWGCWLYSHPSGAGGYASRACYPARPMLTVKAVIRPHAVKSIAGRVVLTPHIEIRSITL